jgi:hypothetical protein
MATIRQLRGRWQAMVRRRGVPPRCKSFDKRTDATRWARELEAEADRSGWVADSRLAEKTTLGELLTRYRDAPPRISDRILPCLPCTNGSPRMGR